MRKRGQEEIAGFAIILVIVSIILLVFLVSYLKDSSSDELQSHEVNSFIQSSLQFTTDCQQNSENLTIQDLIFECEYRSSCSNGLKTCDVLNETLKKISEAGWNVEKGSSVKGYDLNILVNNQSIIDIKEGVVTKEYKGSEQNFEKSGNSVYIFFKAYY